MAVVFVNFNSEHLIVPRAERLRRDGLLVVVADNSGSYPGGTADQVLAGPNEGFGAGCNRAVAAIGSDVDVVCFHNPDAEVDMRTLRALEAALRSGRRPGIVAPAERVGTRVRSTGYHYPTAARELLLGVRALTRSKKTPTVGAKLTVRPKGPSRPLGEGGKRFASGALLVVDRRAFEAVGGFDERYFLYAEDLDLWHRIQANGDEVDIRTDLFVDHLWARSSGLNAASREVLRWLGVELFAESTGSPWRPMRLGHRALLPALAGGCPALAAEVRRLWRSRCTPSETLAALRPQLVAGSL